MYYLINFISKSNRYYRFNRYSTKLLHTNVVRFYSMVWRIFNFHASLNNTLFCDAFIGARGVCWLIINRSIGSTGKQFRLQNITVINNSNLTHPYFTRCQKWVETKKHPSHIIHPRVFCSLGRRERRLLLITPRRAILPTISARTAFICLKYRLQRHSQIIIISSRAGCTLGT